MKEHEIFWTIRAAEDINLIYLYLSEEVSPDAAKKVLKKIMRTTLGLRFMPYLGAVEPRLAKLNAGHRRLIVKPYKIIYNIRKNKVYIHRIFDSRQNPEKMK